MVKKDIFILTGSEFSSNAILILNNDEAVMVDGLASHKDAIKLKEIISKTFKAKMKYILTNRRRSEFIESGI